MFSANHKIIQFLEHHPPAVGPRNRVRQMSPKLWMVGPPAVHPISCRPTGGANSIKLNHTTVERACRAKRVRLRGGLVNSRKRCKKMSQPDRPPRSVLRKDLAAPSFRLRHWPLCKNLSSVPRDNSPHCWRSWIKILPAPGSAFGARADSEVYATKRFPTSTDNPQAARQIKQNCPFGACSPLAPSLDHSRAPTFARLRFKSGTQVYLPVVLMDTELYFSQASSELNTARRKAGMPRVGPTNQARATVFSGCPFRGAPILRGLNGLGVAKHFGQGGKSRPIPRFSVVGPGRRPPNAVKGSVYLPRCMKISPRAMKNLNNLPRRLKNLGIVGNNYRPISVKYLLSTDDLSIIRWFSSIAHVLLNYYYPAQNFLSRAVRETINYCLRYSLLATLGNKHGKSIAWAIRSYGKSPSVMLRNTQGECTKISCFTAAKIHCPFGVKSRPQDVLPQFIGADL